MIFSYNSSAKDDAVALIRRVKQIHRNKKKSAELRGLADFFYATRYLSL